MGSVIRSLSLGFGSLFRHLQSVAYLDIRYGRVAAQHGIQIMPRNNRVLRAAEQLLAGAGQVDERINPDSHLIPFG